jgi:hypothetical protein
MQEQEKNIVTLDFSNQNIPLPYESKNTSDNTYVTWGLNNLYPNFLIDLYNQSSTHSAIVNQKTNYIIGNGLKDVNGNPVNFDVNAADDIKEFMSKVIKDYILFNSFAVEVLFNVFGQPIEYNHIPMHKIRMNKSKTKFWFCEDWATTRKTITYDRYSYVSNKGSESKIFYFDGYFPSLNNVYATPEYAGTLKSVLTDISIKEFNLNNIRNHFSPSTIITFFNGNNVSKKAKDEIIDEINNKFKGESGKKFIVDFQHKDGKSAEINQLSANDWDKAYVEVSNKNTDDILIGHQVQNPSLFGIKTAGQLGSSQELEVSYEILKNNYIQVKRSELLVAMNQLFKGFDKVASALDIIDKPLFSSKITDALKEKIYTINELRELAGLPNLVNGDRLLSEPSVPVVEQPETTLEKDNVQVNENLKNLTGRQWQNLNRIIRKFEKGEITLEQAKMFLKSSLGLNDSEINVLLSITEEPDSLDLTDEDYEQIKHMGTDGSKFEVIEEGGFSFQEFDKESDIGDYIVKKNLTNTTIDKIVEGLKEENIKATKSDVQKVLKKLSDGGVYKVKINDDRVSITSPESTEPQVERVTTMYRYVKRDGVSGGVLLPTSRAFCVKLIENNKLYTREEIQIMSSIFGYDVYKLGGGFWRNKDTGDISTHCRHTWQRVRVRPIE